MSLTLIVTGMHRSGTSFTASCLQAMGVNLGERLLDPNAFNKKGYFEDIDFLEFQRELLKQACYQDELGWTDWGWTVSEFLNYRKFYEYVEPAKELIRSREQKLDIWGWKDPRTTLMLDFWHSLLPEAKYLFVYRFPWEVLGSIFNSNHPAFTEYPNYGLNVWSFYNRHLLNFYQKHSEKSCLISLNRFIEQPRKLLELINNKFNFQVNQENWLEKFNKIYDERLLTNLPLTSPIIKHIYQKYPECFFVLEELDKIADLSSGFYLELAGLKKFELYQGVLALPPIEKTGMPETTSLDLSKNLDDREIVISIIIPCYNHGEYILEAISSIESCQRTDYEIIIINDGSTDVLTKKIMRYLQNSGYQVINQINQGLAKARNIAISHAKGRYILPLDSDNKIKPGYIIKGIEILDKFSEIGVVYSDVEMFGDAEHIRQVPEFNINEMAMGNYIDACAVFRKKVWLDCGGYDENIPDKLGYEDWDFWLMAAAQGWQFHHICEVLFSYRVRKDSMYHNCLIPENHEKLMRYFCTKHMDIYKTNFADIVSKKDAAMLREMLHNQKLSVYLQEAQATGEAMKQELEQIQASWTQAQQELQNAQAAFYKTQEQILIEREQWQSLIQQSKEAYQSLREQMNAERCEQQQEIQQMDHELTHAQARLKELEDWNRELQTRKDWLESQWQTWMLKAQKLGVGWEQSRVLIQQMQGSKFWKLRNIWLKLKQKLGRISTDPLQPDAHTFTPGIQEFVARIAGQKIRFFQSTVTQPPVVSIISSYVQELEYVETTYRSIINQTLQNFEWIIIDDGSTHPEAKALLVALSQRTDKIRILSHTKHQGIAASYNTAVAEAKSEYLCFVDIGSILDPTYLEKCVLFLEIHPQISVVNSYSIVFQAQEHWWHSQLNQPVFLFQQNGMMSHPLYRKIDFNQLGGFDASLQNLSDWERGLKAITNGQLGWTIPEYLDCYRATLENAPVITQRLDQQQAIDAIKSRYQSFFANPPVSPLEPHPLDLKTLNFRLNLENQCTLPHPGKRILLFCDALDNSESAKWNCDLVTWLDKCGYDITIVTTATSNHSCQEFFYRATPDIFHLPSFLERAYWLAFIRYILIARQIDSILISGSDIAYSFLPLLKIEFPKIALIDYNYMYPVSEQSSRVVNRFSQFTEALDCQIVPSQQLARAYKSLNSSASTKIKVCYSQSEIEAILSNAIGLYKAAVQAYPSVELETEALLLILESLQQE